jgi:hypothetical protein
MKLLKVSAAGVPGIRNSGPFGLLIRLLLKRGVALRVPDDRKPAPGRHVSAYPSLAETLVSVFDSQISGGKRYDLATKGRRQANATYLDAHKTDQAKQLSLALDLTPLIENEQLDRFRADVLGQIRKL